MAQSKHGLRARLRSRRRNPVFLDAGTTRARVVKGAAALSFVIALAWAAAFALNLYYVRILPETDLVVGATGQGASPQGAADMVVQPTCTGDPIPPGADLVGARGWGTAAYLRVWPDASLAALAPNCGRLDQVLAEWLRIDLRARTVEWLGEARSDAPLRALAGTAPATRLELVARIELPSAFSLSAGALEDAEARRAILDALTGKLAGGPYAGLCLYPEGYADIHREGLRAFLADLRTRLPAGKTTCLIAEAEGALWRDPAITAAVDSVVLQAFRLPDSTSAPEALAPQPWFETLIAEAREVIGPQRLRIALGAFGRQWIDGRLDPIPLSYADTMDLATRNASTLGFAPPDLNTHIAFDDAAGARREIWLLDAPSLRNQISMLEALAPAGIVLWTAGLEDPGVWPFLAKGAPPVRAADIEAVRLKDFVAYEGEGPFRRTLRAAADGQRQLYRDTDTGLVSGVFYDPLPRPFLVERYGKREDKIVALTFDDGPDPAYTTAILDTLKAQAVPATFFLVGTGMLQEPDIVRRMVAEGHEVGSHTFFHPGNDAMSEERLRVELNSVQRLLASITGRTTYLFRMPYGRSEGPLTAFEAAPMQIVEGMGYVVAGSDIVPRDWENLSAEEIAEDVMAGLTTPGSQVIVLHDAGGDRSATATSVGLIIDRLRAEGYGFVPLSSLIGLTRDQVMPEVGPRYGFLDDVAFAVMASVGKVLYWLFWGAIVYGVTRSSLVLALALLRRRHRAPDGGAPVSVTVIIPALNEENVIVEGVQAALASDHPDLRVIVVDDGSTDDTAKVVSEAFGADPRVSLIRQANGGKWSAINAAYTRVATEVVVAVDADTLLLPDAIGLLARHFADPAVGAVAGNVKVGNRSGLLPWLQTLEYVTAQNIDRRAAERLNAMLVVPGSIGAWRVSAVARAGLYSGDTITEDADLTVAVLRAGYRVVFEERAQSRTEVPETVRAFLRQRLRWTFGMMQTAWKHRRAAATAPGAGLFSIPDLFLTGVALGLLAPVADFVFLWALVDAARGWASGELPTMAGRDLPILLGWLALPATDLVFILVALLFERRESKALILFFPLYRLVYRPLLYITVWRAVGRALVGHVAAWGKLVRRGTALGLPPR
ncbi:glycosyltransferase [Albidovulum sediminicola]|uniref:Chitooligosaccharide deacetylase n=1 Tax=Albidovulum sediminicola TaxID=2984331 RepID=A0ABT2Z3F6_9RHOB|nr:glycosyltransferase [Defluviimonas sp. WL0075]MCV2865540.1 glycosyltransferase [Defluviimonas sp. WL0075]